ncbi:zinc ribbon domain-containing protein [Dapis sp. BLCC M126]|uniref:zinc ribbon domain-containing protein n=1 Tax=Dapis sp. BLCC M126 TaxID=3400189 RepID=UPI003CF4F6A5
MVTVEPPYTSQNCSNCNILVVKNLITRTHNCFHCGYIADRHQNAAKSILQSPLKKLSTTLGHKESNAFGEICLCSDGKNQTK